MSDLSSIFLMSVFFLLAMVLSWILMSQASDEEQKRKERQKKEFLIYYPNIKDFNRIFKQDYKTILNAFSPFFETRIKWIRQHRNNCFAWGDEPKINLNDDYIFLYHLGIASEVAFLYKSQLSRMYINPLHHEEPCSFEYFLKNLMQKEYTKIAKEFYDVENGTIEL